MEHFCDSIQGWFDFDDIYVEQVKKARDGAVFVEVGAWLGRSTAFMCVEIANAGRQIDFYVVDTWRGSPSEVPHQAAVQLCGGSIRASFDENLDPVRGYFRPMEMNSLEAASRFPDESIDFVFIDANHDYEAVVADIRAWAPKLRAGGVLAGHDIGWSGVRRAIDEQLPGYRTRRSSWEFDVFGVDGGGRGRAPVEVVVPYTRPAFAEIMLRSFAAQWRQPALVTLVGNAVLPNNVFGLNVRALRFSSETYAIGMSPGRIGDTSLRRNIGLAHAQYPAVLFWDDDQFAPWRVVSDVEAYLGRERYMFGNYRYIDTSCIASPWLMSCLAATAGQSRETPPNASHLWQSGYGGFLGIQRAWAEEHVGYFDMAIPGPGIEDQDYARRLSLAAGHQGRIFVHEPPFAFHPIERVPYAAEPQANVCQAPHDIFISQELGVDVVKCRRCPFLVLKDPDEHHRKNRIHAFVGFDSSRVKVKEVPVGI